jgi:predicted RNA-binding Zn-ribbon protein involved in translation (DUF1610 family)
MPKSNETGIQALLTKIHKDYPDVSFVVGERFSWHPGKGSVSFQDAANNKPGIWSLLHEVGHALLHHDDYRYDIELLQLEVAAWEKARKLALEYKIQISEDYVQDCLDTYRDWLHMRATCPVCSTRSLQASSDHYHCFNCGAEWQVSRSRLCRPYRLKTAV